MSELALGSIVAQNPAAGVVGPVPSIVNGKIVGEVFTMPLNYIAPSPAFPAACLTSFTGTEAIAEANYPLLVPLLRAQKLIYLEGLVGEAATFAGTAAGSVVTLTANTANEDLAAGLAEWHADMGEYPAVVIGGTTYEVTNVDSVTLEITLGAAPTAGAVTLEVYPHRIASSDTTARLWSWVGKTAIGAGTTETLAMMMRRDQMQLITGGMQVRRGTSVSLIPFTSEAGALSRSSEDGDNSSPIAVSQTSVSSYDFDQLLFDSGDSPDARVSGTTATSYTRDSTIGSYWSVIY